jgi:hypothetical protein
MPDNGPTVPPSSQVGSVGINWLDANGDHRGFTISAGQAHVGHLVGLILANCGTDIEIAKGARPKRLASEQEMREMLPKVDDLVA